MRPASHSRSHCRLSLCPRPRPVPRPGSPYASVCSVFVCPLVGVCVCVCSRAELRPSRTERCRVCCAVVVVVVVVVCRSDRGLLPALTLASLLVGTTPRCDGKHTGCGERWPRRPQGVMGPDMQGVMGPHMQGVQVPSNWTAGSAGVTGESITWKP